MSCFSHCWRDFGLQVSLVTPLFSDSYLNWEKFFFWTKKSRLFTLAKFGARLTNEFFCLKKCDGNGKMVYFWNGLLINILMNKNETIFPPVPSWLVFPQVADGVPVHLKRGYPDKLLYRTTMALTVGGALYCLVALYMAAQPRKWPKTNKTLAALCQPAF